jgi:C4-dicarboxylate-specific signal transduction histidine kinase
VSQAASAPTYGVARNWLGDGIVGGAAMQFADDGVRAGRLVARVLSRAPGEPMPPPEVPALPLVVDWRQLQRWSLSESRLPPGTEVLFRPPTVWERHRTTILGSLAVMGAQAVLIVLLLLERRRRIRAQQFLQEQAAYDQLMAELTIDTVRHAPAESPSALEDGLARIGTYAGASAALLTVNAEPYQAPIRLFWSDPAGEEKRAGPADTSPFPDPRVEIALGTGDTKLGLLELYRADGAEWSKRLQARVEAAGELIAGALARARAARALEESRGQVAHMARVATFSQLAAAVSHELRQPLTSIRAHAETGAMLLGQPAPNMREAREIFQDILRDDARATEVIDHIRMLLRNEKPASAAVDLNGVCQQAVQLLERAAGERGVSLGISLERQLPSVRGDAVQLQQVVLNLTLNALDAAASSELERRVFVGTIAQREHVEVFVRDLDGPPSHVTAS